MDSLAEGYIDSSIFCYGDLEALLGDGGRALLASVDGGDSSELFIRADPLQRMITLVKVRSMACGT